MHTEKFQFSLRRLLLLTALFCVVFGGIRFVYLQYTGIFKNHEAFSAIWLTHDMLKVYMSKNDGQWPSNWDSMKNEFDLLNQTYGASDLDWLKKRIHVDFDFDPALLVDQEQDGPIPQPLLSLPNNRLIGELEEANKRLWKAIRFHLNAESK